MVLYTLACTCTSADLGRNGWDPGRVPRNIDTRCHLAKPASFMVALVPIILGDFDGLLCGCFFASEGARMGEWLLFGFDVVIVYTSTVI